MQGLHLIGDLYGCEARLLNCAGDLRPVCLGLCTDGGLTVVGDCFYQFDNGGVTGMVLLAESHLAIHTWPETGNVTLDVYVCNYRSDNRAKAQALFDALVALLRPSSARCQYVERGES